MSSLDLNDTFAELAPRLRAGSGLSAARTDPFFYFVFPPEQALEVKRHMRAWTGRLNNDGITVERVSFSDLLWEIVDASGRWGEWVEIEPDVEPDKVNDAIGALLRNGNALVERIAQRVEQPRPKRTVVFLTEVEMLHPYFRVRTLESALHDRVQVPTVVFYPGRRSGQFGLHFLDFYPEDSNYRATVLGGLE